MPSDIVKPDFDIHQALAAMADHPSLLRKLGVIRTVTVDVGTTELKPGPVTIKLTPKFPGGAAAPAISIPAYLTPSRFSLFDDGRRDVDDIDVVEVDTD